jgi:hypothetical protein
MMYVFLWVGGWVDGHVCVSVCVCVCVCVCVQPNVTAQDSFSPFSFFFVGFFCWFFSGHVTAYKTCTLPSFAVFFCWEP